jgi:hypothetical protein
MFNKKTVDNVLKVFYKAIEDLNEVIAAESVAIDVNTTKKDALEQSIAESTQEITRAVTIKAKLQALVEQD